MVIINVIRGGVGNQLFQWAITKVMEIKYGAEIYMDLQHVGGAEGVTSRTFDLPQFPNLKYKILDTEGSNKYFSKPIIECTEVNFDINNTELTDEHSYRFFDYWQRYSYFDDYRETIESELSCPEKIKNEILQKYPELNTNSVSLHVRRTDYLTSNGFHPVMSLDYYKSALDIIGDYQNLFIFSDDIEWCKKHLNFKNQFFVEGNSASFDIWTMSFCQNNIIANSSFSWWGAWLNKNKNKKVITPHNWFSSGGVPFMHPKNWYVI